MLVPVVGIRVARGLEQGGLGPVGHPVQGLVMNAGPDALKVDLVDQPIAIDA